MRSCLEKTGTETWSYNEILLGTGIGKMCRSM